MMSNKIKFRKRGWLTFQEEIEIKHMFAEDDARFRNGVDMDLLLQSNDLKRKRVAVKLKRCRKKRKNKMAIINKFIMAMLDDNLVSLSSLSGLLNVVCNAPSRVWQKLALCQTDRFFLSPDHVNGSRSSKASRLNILEQASELLSPFIKFIQSHFRKHTHTKISILSSNPHALDQGMHYDYCQEFINILEDDEKPFACVLPLHDSCILILEKDCGHYVRANIPFGMYALFRGDCCHAGGANEFDTYQFRVHIYFGVNSDHIPTDAVYAAA